MGRGPLKGSWLFVDTRYPRLDRVEQVFLNDQVLNADPTDITTVGYALGILVHSQINMAERVVSVFDKTETRELARIVGMDVELVMGLSYYFPGGVSQDAYTRAYFEHCRVATRNCGIELELVREDGPEASHQLSRGMGDRLID